EDRRGSPAHAAQYAAAARSQRDCGARGGRCAHRRQAHLAAQRLLQGKLRRHAADRQFRGPRQGALALMRWLAAGLLVLAAGCASAPAPNNSSLAKARLSEAETRAANLAKSGDFPGAARHYAEALRIATSLENADAIAANAINLSVVQQRLGRDSEARAALAAVLDDPRTPFSERR